MSGRRGVRQTFAQCASKCNNISGCHAVEMWFAYNWNCYWCTKPELIRPYTNKRDLAYPVHVWTRSKCYRSLGILSKDVFIERCTSTESGLFAFLGSRPGGVAPYDGLNGEAPLEGGIFCRLQVYKRVEISLAEA